MDTDTAKKFRRALPTQLDSLEPGPKHIGHAGSARTDMANMKIPIVPIEDGVFSWIPANVLEVPRFDSKRYGCCIQSLQPSVIGEQSCHIRIGDTYELIYPLQRKRFQDTIHRIDERPL